MATRLDYSMAVLTGLSVPKANGLAATGARRAIVSWSLCESGFPSPDHPNQGKCNGVPLQGANYNILNTTLPMPGSTDYNAVPVQNYLTFTSGVDATVNTLLEPRYTNLLAAIRKPYNTAQNICMAVGDTDWGTPISLLIPVLNTTYQKDRARFNSITVGV